MKKYFSLLLLALCVIFYGCPYESAAPLGDKTASKYNKQLDGIWWHFNNEDGTKMQLVVEKADKQTASVKSKMYAADGTQDDSQLFRAYNTTVNGVEIMNVENRESKFIFYMVQAEGKDEMVIAAIGEDFVKANLADYKNASSAQLLKFVQDNISNAKLFEQEMHFFKKDSKLYEAKRKEFRAANK